MEGGDGNSSVADLEVRVETLEGTAADHDTRLTASEENIQGKGHLLGVSTTLMQYIIVVKLTN